MPVNTGKLVTESVNNGPKPLVHFLGHTSETMVEVEGWREQPWWTTGSQISALNEGFWNERGLRISSTEKFNGRGVACLHKIGGHYNTI